MINVLFIKENFFMYYFYNKKIRGQRRKLNALFKNIDRIVPFCNTDGDCEHFHVPCSMFIQSPKTSGKIKTAFCQKWLEKTGDIIERKPENLTFCKVVALIDVPNYWNSQIIIFYSQSYYDTFWDRNDSFQRWEALDLKAPSFVKSRNIKTVLFEKGYMEIIKSDEVYEKSILWFYGDLSYSLLKT